MAREVVLGPEVAADRATIGGTGHDSKAADVAWSGSQYLAVWIQRNVAFGPWIPRAVRIAPDGSVLDRGGIDLLCSECGGPPRTAAFQGAHLVVLSGAGFFSLLQVSADGAVTQVATSSEGEDDFSYAPDIASAGTTALIAFNMFVAAESRYHIRASLYDGAVLHPSVDLGFADNDSAPRVAAQPGGGYLVVWHDSSDDVRGRLVNAAGAAGASVTIASGTVRAVLPDVDVAGGNFVAAWNHQGSPFEIRAATISPTGVVSAPATVAAAYRTVEPSISCSDDCLVLWRGGPDSSTNDLHGRRVDAALQPVSDEVILAGGDRDQGPGASAGAGGEHYLVWGDALSGVYEVRGATATDAGAGFEVGTPSLLATDRHQEYRPDIAAAGSAWLVAWRDSRNGGGDIFGKRFTFDVVPKTPVARPIHERPAIQDFVRLGWNGDRFLAAWADEDTPGALRATRLEPNGTVLDPAGITIGTGNTIFCMGVEGGAAGDWLVSWTRNNGNGRTLVTSVVAADGTRTTPRVVSDTASSFASIAYDRPTGLYVIVWYDPSIGQLLARRIAPDGTLPDPAAVVVATGIDDVFAIDMAAGSGILFIAWTADNILHGARMRVATGGIDVLDPAPIPLVTTSATRRGGALASVARGFLLAWSGHEAGQASFDIWGLQISAGGTVHGAPILLAGGPQNERSPALSGISQGRALLAFQRDASGVRSRVYLRRLVAGYPNGTTCSEDAQCESGFCADGRCCDSECGGGAVDCQACSVSAGAAVDGVCGVVAADEVCRVSEGFCDLAERCDGVSVDCPDDRGRREGQVCDAQCDAVCPLNDESGSPHVCPVCP